MAALSEENKKQISDVISTAIAAIPGLELVETKFYTEFGSRTVEALLWRKEGVDLNLCERAHGYISDALDSVDELFEGAYVLKVSSMGLDRPIVTDDDFRRALDTEIEFKGADGKKKHGVLKAYDAESITLSDEKGERNFDRKFITKVQPYIRF